MKNKICAIIFLVFYCLASLAIIGYDLKESLAKDEEILYNINEEKPIPKFNEDIEEDFTIKVNPPKLSEIELISESSTEVKQQRKVEKKKTQSSSEQSSESSYEIVVESENDEGETNRKHVGRCRLTIYTPNETHWGYTTATGVKSAHLVTCAVDPRIIPYGSTIVLSANGNEWRLKAVDCGNFRGKMIDVFYDGSVSAGVSWLVSMFGSEYAEVWIER